MNRSIRILACAGALLSLLTFAVPAHAAGRAHSAPDIGILQAAWDWIAGLWMPGNSVQGQRHGKKRIGIDPDGLQLDHGPGIDPDGKPSTATTPSCTVQCGTND